MDRSYRTLLALSLVLSGLFAVRTVQAAVTVQSQHARVFVRAASDCEPTGASPAYQIAETTALGPVELSRAAAEFSECGDVAANSQLSVELLEDSIRGTGSFFGSLDAVGVMHTAFDYAVEFEVDQPTPYRIELRWSLAHSGDDAQLFGIIPSFSDGGTAVAEPGMFAWEGTLEPGVSYEFAVSGVADRASLGLPDGSYRANDGSSAGSMQLSMEFQSAGVVATETVSMAQMKAQY